jgi:hypothetical protein
VLTVLQCGFLGVGLHGQTLSLCDRGISQNGPKDDRLDFAMQTTLLRGGSLRLYLYL